MKKIVFIFIAFPSYVAACPSGFVAVEYDHVIPATAGACPMGYVAYDELDVCCGASGACWLVRMGCASGVSTIKTSTGLSVPLYAEKSTNPSIHVKYNGMTCYADLAQGNAINAINIQYNGIVYHTTD